VNPTRAARTAKRAAPGARTPAEKRTNPAANAAKAAPARVAATEPSTSKAGNARGTTTKRSGAKAAPAASSSAKPAEAPLLALVPVHHRTRSYLRGAPALPANMQWPMVDWHDREPYPMSHLATLDCAELRAAGASRALPKTGLLVFFANEGPYVSTRDFGRVYYLADRGTFTQLPANPHVRQRPAINVSFEPTERAPNTFGGDATTLLRLRGTAKDRFEWGDGGRLVFTLGAKDLAAGRFARAQAVVHD
jgi:hypothetical protein